VRAIASGSHPEFEYYWNTGRDFGPVDLRQFLRAWAEARDQVVAFERGLSPTQLSHTGVHRSFAEITVHDYLKIDLKRDQGHLSDLQRSLEAARGGSASLLEA